MNNPEISTQATHYASANCRPAASKRAEKMNVEVLPIRKVMREKGGITETRTKKKKLNRKDRKEKAQRAQSNTRSPCGLCVSFAPFAVQFLRSPVSLPPVSLFSPCPPG
jgi:hypothetical protein